MDILKRKLSAVVNVVIFHTNDGIETLKIDHNGAFDTLKFRF